MTDPNQVPGSDVPGGPQGNQSPGGQTTDKPGSGQPEAHNQLPPGAQPPSQGADDKLTLSDGTEITLEGLTRNEEGYTLTVGKSVYKGTSFNEVIQKATKGIVDKDAFIATLQGKQATRVSEEFLRSSKQDKDDEPPPAAPIDETKIYREAIQTELKSHPDIKVEMLSWDKAKWREYEEANELRPWEVAELRSGVREVLAGAKKSAEEQIDNMTVQSLNEQAIRDESNQVAELIAESGIDAEAFDYKAVLDRATKQVNKNGIIKSGAIVREASKEIMRLLGDGRTSPIAKKIKEDIARAAETRNQIPGQPGTLGGSRRSPASTVPASYDDAMSDAIKELNAGSR